MGTKRKMVDSGVEWIGEVPKAWEIQRLKDLVVATSGSQQIKGTLYEESKPELFPAYSASGQDVWSEKVDFRKDGIVLSAVGARCGKCFKANGAWAATANTHVIFTKNEETRDFFWYLLNDEDMWIKGGTAQPFVQVQATLRKEVALPPLPEQQAIATFLDHHVGLIDRDRELIAQKIGLLKDKRKALIFECVTGKRTIVEAQHLAGVDDWTDIVGSGPLVAVPTPGQDDPFVKGGRLVDSGVEWIGEVPADWETYRLGAFFMKTKTLSGGSLPPGALSHGRVVEKTSEKLPDSTRITYQDVLVGDFLLNPINLNYDLKSLRTGLSSIDVCVSPAYIVMKRRSGCAEYLKYALHIFDIYRMKELGAGVRQTIGFPDIQREPIVAPSAQEQQAIADFLDLETGLIDREIELLETKSSLLADKRKALIFEAVTGKIDCTQP